MEKCSGNSASCLAEFSVCRCGPGTWRFHVDPTCGACLRLNLLTWLSLAGNLFGSSCISIIVCPCMSVYVHLLVCVCVFLAQLCPTPTPWTAPPTPGSSTHPTLQAGILELFVISSSGGISLTQGSNPGLLHCSQTLQMYVDIIYKQYI